jgi:UDP-N-acetylglucosamine--N-acetylmuramyl-(pentapeptide) pyrophosphoryl-undecaprenol N-acetylglucosamine transferase
MAGESKYNKKAARIIISGGGTGGHIFPAIAIADELRKQLQDPEILFVGAEGRMEMEKVPAAGYRIVGLPVAGFRRELSLQNIGVVLKLMASMRKAGRVLRDFSPDLVVGVGGYASGPVLRRAASRGIPTLIQEQNSYAGVTNRLLARKARKICVAYEGMDKYFPAEKLVLAGNPVRREIAALFQGTDDTGAANASAKDAIRAARQAFGFSMEDEILLVLGGSLGARSINNAVRGGLDKILASELKLIWQCGSYYYEEMKSALAGIPEERIRLYDFISGMDQAYLAADAIIARAGALTISELCLVGKPSVLVPSPNVAEDHQTKNARALESRGAAILVPDPDAGEKMIPTAIGLCGDPLLRKTLAGNILKMAIPDSAERIAREAIELMKE